MPEIPVFSTVSQAALGGVKLLERSYAAALRHSIISSISGGDSTLIHSFISHMGEKWKISLNELFHQISEHEFIGDCSILPSRAINVRMMDFVHLRVEEAAIKTINLSAGNLFTQLVVFLF